MANPLDAVTSSEEKHKAVVVAEVPNHICIEYILNPEIKARYYSNRQIEFTSPPNLNESKFKATSLFDASYIIRGNKPSFPYSDWRIYPLNPHWTPWTYEQRVCELNSKLNKQVVYEPIPETPEILCDTEHIVASKDATEHYVTVSKQKDQPKSNKKKSHESASENSIEVDPHELSDTTWETSYACKTVSNWIQTNTDPHRNLVLREITHFRRYSAGLGFEFLCVWNVSDSKIKRCWVKYVDLKHNNKYIEYMKGKWDPKIEKERNWEEETRKMDYDSDVEFDNEETYNQIYSKAEQKTKAKQKSHKRRRSTSKTKRKRKTRESEDDEDDALSEEALSEEDDEALSDEESDHLLNSRPLVSIEQQPVAWQEIFNTSSVDPTPRFKVKVFNKPQ